MQTVKHTSTKVRSKVNAVHEAYKVSQHMRHTSGEKALLPTVESVGRASRE